MSSRKLRSAIAILASASFLSIPSLSQGQEGFALRSKTGLAGTFFDPLQKQPMWFDASAENGVVTLRLDLHVQSLTLRHGQGEFHLDSSNNTARGFSTLSDEERGGLRRLAAYLDRELEPKSALDASIICMIRNLSAWPPEMPLFVSIDPAMQTVGEVSVSIEEIREARRQAMDALSAQLPSGEVGITANSITTFCSRIGRAQKACYPTSLKPYKEKCENVLVGGTTCRGRCGTTCSGLCSQQRYTQDCHSHDRCADVHGITHRYCNFIFPPTFDDCAAAPDCVDFPGVWTITFKWTGSASATTSLKIDPKRTFTADDGAAGTWSATDTTAKLTISGGCKPVYTGTLSNRRLTASGTMKCTTRDQSGTWSASKTNGILPPASNTKANDPATSLDGRGALSGQSD